MKLTPTKPFLRDLKGLSKTDAYAVAEAMALFMREPHTRGLNFEKVTSRSGYFTIRGTYSIRVLLFQDGREDYSAVAVGNHDYIYASYFKK
ncbi:hypothetical protein [Rhizobium sp. LC145]|uniref:hypothetical protein n=1 Tax=Rhizobium sp. LC145 TaxID=1120688 RepID=UPI000629FD6B|nr:hypothetical protein [Rhizobium sp. LC145]KKX25290.1 hypothetical protein YH62_25410 [Rhizobium sp. LC145]TKT45311.1 hypothetical protein FDR95_25570 [Rhizobiaceae bacterium LC148]